MPLIDALPYLPELPVGGNSTMNGTIPIPGLGDVPAPFDVLGLITFSQTSFTLVTSFYVAWQNFTKEASSLLKANEQQALDIVAALHHRSESILEVEKDESNRPKESAVLIETYRDIEHRINLINSKTFFQRWLMATQYADELRHLSAQAEKVYQLYLIKVNLAIYADADNASNGVDELKEKMDKIIELLAAKSG